MHEDPMTISLKAAEKTAQPTVHETRPSKKMRRKRRVLSMLFILAVSALVIGGGWYGYQAISHTFFAKDSGDVRTLVGKVSRLMVLPDEPPTLAVVSDLAKLQGQLFFAHAKEGDVVLMYPKAQKAILYRPSIDKIIEVAPITNDAQK